MQKNKAQQQEHTINTLQWKIGGEAGFGVKIVGQMFSRMCIRAGLHIYDYAEYPSLIRGGHNTFQVAVREKPVRSVPQKVDLLIALNQATLDLHINELSEHAAIIYDGEQPGISTDLQQQKGVRLLAVPLMKLAVESGGSAMMRNVVALGASAGVLKFDVSLLESVIHTAFARKGDAVVDANIAAAHAGYEYAKHLFAENFPFALKPVAGREKRIAMTGNTAIAIGAIAANCRYYAAYPMTPSTSILSYLAKKAESTGMVVRHIEDEIAAINSAIGASYAGARSMVGTSGGGFSLMVEGLGLAGMLETPLVVVNAQRPGPSTGLPTWTGQADLQFVLNASQDEFPRAVIAPGDATECFQSTVQGFNIADRFQTPVIILTDKLLAESTADTPAFNMSHIQYDMGQIEHTPQTASNGLFARYVETPSGVSPRTIPGIAGGMHIANSDEHDPFGFADESAENRVTMTEKRMRKGFAMAEELPLPQLYGPHNAAMTLVGWGSTKGVLLDAMDQLAARGVSVNVLHFVYLFPLSPSRILPILRKLKTSLLVEANSTGQFGKLLLAEVGYMAEHRLLQYDGRPFIAERIVEHVLKLHE